MTVNLRNKSGEAISLGSADGRRVEAGEVIHVEGSLAKKQPDDAYLIGTGDAARLYPHSTWTAAGGPKNTEPDVPKPDTKETVK